ncbi:unnamed protein product [Camellia sinensis]
MYKIGSNGCSEATHGSEYPEPWVSKRLEKVQEPHPSVYSNLIEIMKKEAGEGYARKGTSCCRAFVCLPASDGESSCK